MQLNNYVPKRCMY